MLISSERVNTAAASLPRSRTRTCYASAMFTAPFLLQARHPAMQTFGALLGAAAIACSYATMIKGEILQAAIGKYPGYSGNAPSGTFSLLPNGVANNYEYDYEYSLSGLNPVLKVSHNWSASLQPHTLPCNRTPYRQPSTRPQGKPQLPSSL